MNLLEIYCNQYILIFCNLYFLWIDYHECKSIIINHIIKKGINEFKYIFIEESQKHSKFK